MNDVALFVNILNNLNVINLTTNKKKTFDMCLNFSIKTLKFIIVSNSRTLSTKWKSKCTLNKLKKFSILFVLNFRFRFFFLKYDCELKKWKRRKIKIEFEIDNDLQYFRYVIVIRFVNEQYEIVFRIFVIVFICEIIYFLIFFDNNCKNEKKNFDIMSHLIKFW